MNLYRKALLVATVCGVGVSLEERPPAIEHTHTIPPDARFCVDTAPGSYTCSDDPMSVRKKFDPSTYHDMDIGLPQRVDGTELERRGIRKVLGKLEVSTLLFYFTCMFSLKLIARLSLSVDMDAYYYGEVLSNPEYREVRQYWYVFDKA